MEGHRVLPGGGRVAPGALGAGVRVQPDGVRPAARPPPGAAADGGLHVRQRAREHRGRVRLRQLLGDLPQDVDRLRRGAGRGRAGRGADGTLPVREELLLRLRRSGTVPRRAARARPAPRRRRRPPSGSPRPWPSGLRRPRSPCDRTRRRLRMSELSGTVHRTESQRSAPRSVARHFGVIVSRSARR